MGKATGFLEIERQDRTYEAPEARVQNFREFVIPLGEDKLREQAARCMDCGVPYCHNGCPVNNQIPDWNDLVYEDDWQTALANLHSTNNFPEFTGRICPAPCEAACTLNIDDSPVTIKSIECAIIDKGWENGWIEAQPPTGKTGKSVAIVGAGPAGMAAAQQLARQGHDVHVYEKHAKAGGLLRYGIPDFKMEKHLIDRRVEQLETEGVTFHYNTNVGVDMQAKELAEKHDALIICGGSEVPRDLPVDGRNLDGVHFAMDFLPQQNRRVGQEPIGDSAPILAEDKHVIVIGGGDTGSDCIGTSFRQGALSVTQLEIMPMPPEKENKGLTWPDWPLKMRTSTSQEEGAIRDFSVMTTGIKGEDGRVTAITCTKVDETMQPIAGSEFELKADLILLAMGFIHPVHEGMLDELSLERDGRGNVAADTATYQTSDENVFACGDMRRGQSLVVWAIREGRQCAREVDLALMGETRLPR
ncbi:MAG: glutamate synthase subunit beta [Rhizobiales bacterium TMED83]|jgi:glutamate synthase (NADPH/NADH) small chain|nr:glutamate synthase [Rhodobiaceae bacterium]RPF92363.1 MAG: glutamate synthase subunit beta [Rhizobiales bacterium TMED83]HCD17569.1 glutamate synthase [Rhodobiaceae bacterium]|tara:strand:+ start:136 stop:1554 length:1419 start_codon:yes stop_codon:yes gene_type:complete